MPGIQDQQFHLHRSKLSQHGALVKALNKKNGDWLHLLTPEEIKRLADNILKTVQLFPAGTVIYSEGQKSTACLWILLKGHVQVKVKRTTGSKMGHHILFSTKTSGTTFGDSTFFSPGRDYPTSLETNTECVFARITQAAYCTIYDRNSILKVKSISLPPTAKAIACLKGGVFQMMSALELSNISEHSSCLWFHAGEKIFDLDETSDAVGPAASLILMLDSGTVELSQSTRDGEEKRILDEPGTMFGEASALLGCARKESAVAATECRLYAFSKESFDLLWLQRPDIHAQMLQAAGEASAHRTRAALFRPHTLPASHSLEDVTVHSRGSAAATSATNSAAAACTLQVSSAKTPQGRGPDAGPQQRFLACIQTAAPLANIADADAFVTQVRAPPRVFPSLLSFFTQPHHGQNGQPAGSAHTIRAPPRRRSQVGESGLRC